MLGHDVRAACEGAGHETLSLVHADLDIADSAAVDAAVGGSQPHVVVNCAAWTNVDGAQAQRDFALAINGPGAGNVARAAAAAGAWTIQISSDYVFNGRKQAPYVESDPVDPLSAYGASKLEGEREVAHAAPDSHTIVRSSWLFGASGSCFPKTILRLAAERDQLDVVCDQVGTPTYTGHLAQALLQLVGAPPLGLLHVACAGRCSWYQFAREIVGAAGLHCELRPIPTAEYPLPAPRPAYSALESERGAPSLPSWVDGLREFMSQTAGVAA